MIFLGKIKAIFCEGGFDFLYTPKGVFTKPTPIDIKAVHRITLSRVRMNIKGKGFVLNEEIFFNTEEYFLMNMVSGKKIRLGKKPSTLLNMLIQCQGEVYSGEEFIELELSKGRVITTSSVTQYISKIRKSLRAVGLMDPVIQTSTGDGYYVFNTIKIELYDFPDDGLMEREVAIPEEGKDEVEVVTAESVVSEPRHNEGEKNHVPGTGHGKFFIGSLIVFFLTFLSLNIYIYFNKFSENKSILVGKVSERYPNHISVDGCEFYFNLSPVESSIDLIGLIKKDEYFECKKDKYKYVTFFDNVPHYTYISCNASIDSGTEKQRCQTIMVFNYG